MSEIIKRKIVSSYPEHADLFSNIKTIPRIRRRDMPLPEAVVRVITGQMLSGTAAQTIYKRIAAAAQAESLSGSWLLSQEKLRGCGLSNAKAQAVRNFGATIGSNPKALEHWCNLEVDDLYREIKSHKGMGDWTAGIIALFYIGHQDVFPLGDGSLSRAVELLTGKGAKSKRGYRFVPDHARPYRSYLALYLWEALDTGVL